MRHGSEQLAANRFDLIVIGGGIHGAWITLRAAQKGLRVALIEKSEFGAATSANSLKILHGGLRYLQHLDFKRMRSSIRARREYLRLFPQFTRPLPCVIPLRSGGVRSPWILGPALMANDLLSADRNIGVEKKNRLPRGQLLRGATCRGYLSPLVDSDAASGALWWDAIALDTSRLVVEPLKTAATFGAVAANGIEALEYITAGDSVRGVVAIDRSTSKQFEITAPRVVNATGPNAEQLSMKLRLPVDYLPPAWLGGLNLVFGKSIGLTAAVALTSMSKKSDSSAVLRRSTRELFFVPWKDATMVGTDYYPTSDLHDLSKPPGNAVENFVAEINQVAPKAGFSSSDVREIHWGLLPTDAATADLPRKSPVLAYGKRETGLNGLAVVVGEKLTSAPVLSEQVVRRLVTRASG